VPILVGFLLIGMLLGSDGPGGVEFDDATLSREVGVVSLAGILFDGGMATRWRSMRPVLVPAALLGSVGVVVTGAVTAAAAWWLFDLRVEGAALLGAVVGSTDAAAVFATLRTTRLRRRISALLEAESGVNDPVAVALTVGLIAWSTQDGYGPLDLALLLVQQLGVGLLAGLALGAAASRVFARFPDELSPFAPVFAMACGAVGFGAASLAGGSGFLAVYIVGLFLGATPSRLRRQVLAFNEGLAFIAQITLFVVLGLLVFPSRLDSVVIPGLVLAGVLTLVARPLAVFLSTIGLGFDRRERLLIGWAGLRGAVPIVLATFPLSKGLPESQTIFDAVFFVVLVSVLVQGLTLPRVAARLGLASRAAPAPHPPIVTEAVRDLGGEIIEHAVEEGDEIIGRAVRDLGLPRRSVITMIVRDGQALPPRGSTTIALGDRLYVLARADAHDDTVRALEGGHPGVERRG
jgi:potassium/hydrogen antiporter